jgi:ATP-dependent DNA helicase DinG
VADAETSLHDLLESAVDGVAGTHRPGQVQMAEAVERAVRTGEHLLVQAGTGTGKSLAYLVPALAHARRTGRPVVIATATLALQAQVVDRDLPQLVEALAAGLGGRPTYGLVKGRRNYLCRHKLVGGFPDEDDALFDLGEGGGPLPDDGPAAGGLGQQMLRLRSWAEETRTGDRDELVPGVQERAWRQVSVSAHECLGGACPLVEECFVEQARAEARESDVVVTNHSILAIDAFEGRQLLPEHDLVVVDEGHELVDRVTSTITDELTAGMVERAARRAARFTDVGDLTQAGNQLRAVLETMAPHRLAGPEQELADALVALRDAARAVQTGLKPEKGEGPDGARQVARAEVDDVFDVTERLLGQSEHDVAWSSADPRRGAALHVAPIGVAVLLRERLYPDRTVVLTSATLELGGSFDAAAGALGLTGPDAPAWRGLDAGSPFDYPKQAILYCAKHLPSPGRDGTSQAALDELAELITAAGGRTLGLFSSRRAAEAAAEAMRSRLDVPVLCQGDDQLPTLVRQFAADARTCLFGTLSLWQGVDVPGSACHLVVIDRIPFPRPDDPLMSARTQAVAAAGGNGFMEVSATYAALRLAQGAGRLVRSGLDRGVVAVLDPRLATARYGSFLRASLPPLWPTAERETVLGALRRLDAEAGPVRPVDLPGSRAEGARDRSETDGPGRPWTGEEDTQLRDGVAIGCTLDELADQFEIEPDVVARRLRALGLRVAGRLIP